MPLPGAVNLPMLPRCCKAAWKQILMIRKAGLRSVLLWSAMLMGL